MKNLKKVILAFSLISVSAYADFKINVSDSDMDKALNIIRLQDIGVGEETYVSNSNFCIDKNNKIKFAKATKVSDDRKYSRYKIKRLPKNKIKISFVTTEYSNKKDRIESFVKQVTGVRKAYCEKMNIFGITSFYTVDSIEGETSLSDLWNNVYLKLK